MRLLRFYLKFVFSKKATKFEKIFTVNLTLTTYCQIDGEDFLISVAFLINTNFTLHQLDKTIIMFSTKLFRANGQLK